MEEKVFIVVSISKNYPVRLLGIFNNVENGIAVIKDYFKVILGYGTTSRIVSDRTGKIFTSRDKSGNLMDTHWALVSEAPMDTPFTSAYLDYLGLHLDKVVFNRE